MDFPGEMSTNGGVSDLIAQIQRNIQSLSQRVAALDNIADRLGGASLGEDREFGERVREANRLSLATKPLMKQLVEKSNEDRSLSVYRERLLNDYTAVLNRMQNVQRRAARSEAADVDKMRRAAAAAAFDDDETSRQSATAAANRDAELRRQQQLQQKSDLEELRQRQQALNQLEQDIDGVNSIFADLARMVHEQGDMVDSIEANVEHATIRVEEGRLNVQQALTYQQSARKKKLFLCICLVLAIIIAALVFHYVL